jgi:hypothetical protein
LYNEGIAKQLDVKMTDKTTEQIWVSAKDGAEITGYTPAYLLQLVKNMFLQPEAERPIQVRNEANQYQIWLPDLIEFVSQYAAGRLNTKVEETWVNTTEGAEITGYHRDYVQRLARDSWNLDEEQRIIKVRQRAGRYELWLPDLFKYIADHGYGPIQKKHSP